MRRRLALLLVLALTGCGPAVPLPAPDQSLPPVLLAEPSPTPQPAASLDPAPPAYACGERAAGPLPAGWVCTETARRDLDGDGWSDVFVILADKSALGTGTEDEWRARVVLAGGQLHELEFAADAGDGHSMIRGFVDIDRDGREDVLVELGRGASTAMVGVFGLGRGGLTQATFEDGTKARLLFAGSVRHGAAVECRSRAGRAELVMRGISNYKADDQWDWTESVYTWVSKVLVLSAQHSGTIKVANPFDPPPNEEAYWSFRCFGIDLF